MIKDAKDKRVKELETIIVLATIFLLLSLVSKKETFIFISFGLLIISLLSKNLTSRFVDLWSRFSYMIGDLNTKVILFFIFYIFLTPISIIYRFFTKNPLQLKKDEKTLSYFHTRNHNFKKDDFEKIW